MKKASAFLILVLAVSLLLLSPGSSSLAQSTSDPEANKATLTAFFEAEAMRDFARFDEFFVQDFVRHSVATTAVMPEVNVTNLDQYKAFLRETAAMFPDYYNTPQMLIAEGDYVAFYSTFCGTFTENGNRVELPIVGLVRFEDGKMAEMWIEWDNATWNAQMMAAPVETTEAPITGIDDIVGTWRIYSETYGWAAFTTYTEDGIVYPGMVRDCAPDNCIDTAQFAIEGSQIHFLTSETSPDCGEAVYEVFVVSQNGAPVGLRFAPVSEDCYTDRVEALSHITYRVDQ